MVQASRQPQSQITHSKHAAQTATKRRAEGAQPRDSNLARDIEIGARWLDGFMPNNRLPAEAKCAAVGLLVMTEANPVAALAQRFADLTSLPPDSERYGRAEFRNVVYALAQRARAVAPRRNVPAYLAAYELFSSQGMGPHPDRDLPRKWREGLSHEERDERERRYHSWFNHVRNRIALVRRALDPGSALSKRRRARILSEDPLIAEGLSTGR